MLIQSAACFSLKLTDATVNYHMDYLYNELLLSNKLSNKLLVFSTIQMNLKPLYSMKADTKQFILYDFTYITL